VYLAHIAGPSNKSSSINTPYGLIEIIDSEESVVHDSKRNKSKTPFAEQKGMFFGQNEMIDTCMFNENLIT
jgi:hypothetical protein